MPTVTLGSQQNPPKRPMTTPAGSSGPSTPSQAPAQGGGLTVTKPQSGNGGSFTPSTGAAGGSAMTDPAYAAYLRGMGVEESEITNILNTRIGALTRQLGRELPAYAAQKEQALKETGQAYEGRGFFRSGNRMAEQNRVGIEQDRARMDFEASIRDQMAELYGTSAMDLGRLRRQQAEEALAAQQAAAIANANAGIF